MEYGYPRLIHNEHGGELACSRAASAQQPWAGEGKEPDPPPAPGGEATVGTGYGQAWETISLAAVPGHIYLA